MPLPNASLPKLASGIEASFMPASGGGATGAAGRFPESRPKIPPPVSGGAAGGVSAIAAALRRASWAARSSSMPGRVKLGGGGGASGAEGATGAMPANPLSPALTAAAGLGGGGACGGLAVDDGGGGGGGVICTGFAGGGTVTGCACQTCPHFEQRTFRPSGGKTALVS
jgi:hypothetical protein